MKGEGPYRQDAAEEVFDAHLQSEWQEARSKGVGVDVDSAIVAALRAIGVLPRGGYFVKKAAKPLSFRKSWYEAVADLLLGN